MPQDGGPQRDVGRPEDGPGDSERERSAPARARKPREPAPDDERRDDHRVLLAQHAERERRGAPADASPDQCGVDREHRKQRRHQLGAPRHVRHRLDVHGMHGEQQAGDERAPLAGPAPRQRGHGDTRPRMPEEIDEVEPRGAAEPRIDCVGGDGERPVQLAAESGRPIGVHEDTPNARWVLDEGIERDNRAVVEGKAVPESADVDDDGRTRHGEIESRIAGELHERPSLRAWATSESAELESPRQRANHA